MGGRGVFTASRFVREAGQQRSSRQRSGRGVFWDNFVELRPYQASSIDSFFSLVSSGNRRILLQAPTGAGKTLLAAEIISRYVSQGKSVLFLAHLRELIFQAKDKLNQHGVSAGVVMAGEERDYNARVQVASVHTLWRRAFKKTAMDLPEADLVVVDECHRAESDSYRAIIAAYPKAVVLGLTATPIRTDGRGLGETFEKMVMTSSIRELTKLGFLVPVRYFAPTVPDLRGIKITAGDYNNKQLESRMDDVKLVGDVVENWSRIAPNRLTVVFATGVNHSLHLRNKFREIGVPAEHMDGNTTKEEREDIFQRMDAREVQVLCNCAVLIEGWDFPPVSCCVLARPTKSLGRYIQMAGRVLRPSPGKTDTLLIDHSGSIYEHGRLEEYGDWVLEKGKGMQTRHKEKKAREKKKDITCVKCQFIYWGRRDCPNCAFCPQSFGEGVEYKDGYLYEVGKGEVPDLLTRTEWFRQLLGYAEENGWKPGWAAHKYKDRFGNWPAGMQKISQSPTEIVRAWVKKQFDKKWRRGDAATGFVSPRKDDSVGVETDGQGIFSSLIRAFSGDAKADGEVAAGRVPEDPGGHPGVAGVGRPVRGGGEAEVSHGRRNGEVRTGSQGFDVVFGF